MKRIRPFQMISTAVAGLLLLVTTVSTARATNHQVQIDEVLGGCAGDSAIQFVEMRMSSPDQNQWGPQLGDMTTAGRARLVFFDAQGNQTGEFVFPSNPPGDFNGSVLIATQAFADLADAPTPDFIIPPSVVAPDGKVCFKQNPANALFPVNLCLSYGAFTGDTDTDFAVSGSCPGNPAGPPTAALPIAGTESLQRSAGFGNFECGQFNADFALAPAAPRNGSGFAAELGVTDGACVVLPAPTPTPTATPTATSTPGSCCSGNDSPGCNNNPCQLCVCALDGFCCATTWDSICASEAANECAASCPCGPPTVPPTHTPTPTRTATPTATPTPVCASTPIASCRTAPRSLLMLQSGSSAKLVWKWWQGETPAEELGDPSSRTNYALCIYDRSGGTPLPAPPVVALAGQSCDAGPCWTGSGRGGFKYVDRAHRHDGLQKVLLKAGPAPKAKIIVKAKGANVPLPALPFIQDPAVTVQLVNSAGSCWSADFPAPALKSGGAQFKDGTD